MIQRNTCGNKNTRVSEPDGLGSGVYMLELQNMIKHYGNHNGYRGLERILNRCVIKLMIEFEFLTLLKTIIGTSCFSA